MQRRVGRQPRSPRRACGRHCSNRRRRPAAGDRGDRWPTIGARCGLVQRVTSASVTVAGEVVGAIGAGLCVLVGVTHDDTVVDARKLADKVWNLRILDDEDGVMNRRVADTGGEVLVVSQFTLYGDTSGVAGPSWIAAARPEHAEPLVQAVVDRLRELGATVATGRFRTEMQVALINDGPVTVTARRRPVAAGPDALDDGAVGHDCARAPGTTQRRPMSRTARRRGASTRCVRCVAATSCDDHRALADAGALEHVAVGRRRTR